MSLTAFVTVDPDGDEAIAMHGGVPMIVAHDKERLTRLRELQHHVAISEVIHIREVVFARASGKRYHIEHDGPNETPGYRGMEFHVLDLHNDECSNVDCHRKHVYMNWSVNRAVDAARGRKMLRRRRQ